MLQTGLCEVTSLPIAHAESLGHMMLVFGGGQVTIGPQQVREWSWQCIGVEKGTLRYRKTWSLLWELVWY